MSWTERGPTAEEKAIDQAYDDAMEAAAREYKAAEGAAEKAYCEAARKAWDAREAALGEVPDAG